MLGSVDPVREARAERMPSTSVKTPRTPVVLKIRVADLGPADRRTFELLFGVDLEDRGIALVSGIAPIETRVSVEDLQSAHHEDRRCTAHSSSA